MAITIRRLSPEELKAETKRVGNSEDNLAEYTDLVSTLQPGDAFIMPVTRVNRDGEAREIIVLSDDENTDMPTMRMFKRRLNAAANTSGLEIKYRPKGHREGEGDNAHYVTERLVVTVSATKPKTIKEPNGSK